MTGNHGKVVFVRYLDHLFCEGLDPKTVSQPCIEAVGFLTHEDPQRIILTLEKMNGPLADALRTGSVSIVKSTIIERREIELPPR